VLTATNAVGTSEALSATLVIQPLPTGLVGRYCALLDRSGPFNDYLGGRIDFTINLHGSFSGYLQLGAERLGFSGRLQGLNQEGSRPTGAATVLKLGSNLLGVNLSDHLRPVDDQYRWNGSLTIGDEVLPFVSTATANQTAPFRGAYTFAMITERGDADESTELPSGKSFGSFTVSAAGLATGSLKLADGKSVTFSVPVEQDGGLSLFQVQTTQIGIVRRVARELPRQRFAVSGSLLAHLLIDLERGRRLDNSSADWYRLPRPVGALDTSYPHGFGPQPLTTRGGPRPVLASSRTLVQLHFSHPMLEFAENHPDVSGNLSSAGTGRFMPNPCGVTLSLSRLTGEFQGAFTLRQATPARTARAASYCGILVDEGDSLVGHGFLLINTFPDGTPNRRVSGSVRLDLSEPR
jgi:hypothetical protein